MKTLIYVIMCVPAVLMTAVGFAMSFAKRDSTMINHHHAHNFNINNYSKKVIPLFAITGILFSLGGIILINNKLGLGITVMFVSLLIFIIRFAVIQRRH